MRPAPRSRSGGRPRSRIHWDKLGRVVLVLVLFAILVSYIGPTLNFVSSWRDSGVQRAELRSLQQENVRLRQRAAALARPDAAERAARKLGMVAVGERAYVIRGLSG
jgi:cell division protein FtsB